MMIKWVLQRTVFKNVCFLFSYHPIWIPLEASQFTESGKIIKYFDVSWSFFFTFYLTDEEKIKIVEMVKFSSQ